MAEMDTAAFLSDIEAVCRKHGLCLSHEDAGGAFLVEPITAGGLAWLLSARRPTEPPKRNEAIEAAARDIDGLID